VRDAFVCVRTLTRLEEVHPERPFNGREWMLSIQDMERRFRHLPGAVENSLRIAEQCQPALDLSASLLPRYPGLGPGESAFSVLTRLVFKGAQKRYGTNLSSRV
jgi:error-prone DNA polymerase